jgi:hypothetical protein
MRWNAESPIVKLAAIAVLTFLGMFVIENLART